MFQFSAKTKAGLEESLGISLSELGTMTADEEKQWVERRNGCKLTYSKKRSHGIVGRGSPLLARKKIRTKEDLDCKSKALFGI